MHARSCLKGCHRIIRSRLTTNRSNKRYSPLDTQQERLVGTCTRSTQNVRALRSCLSRRVHHTPAARDMSKGLKHRTKTLIMIDKTLHLFTLRWGETFINSLAPLNPPWISFAKPENSPSEPIPHYIWWSTPVSSLYLTVARSLVYNWSFGFFFLLRQFYFLYARTRPYRSSLILDQKHSSDCYSWCLPLIWVSSI
jgi:hypothetical protein